MSRSLWKTYTASQRKAIAQMPHAQTGAPAQGRLLSGEVPEIITIFLDVDEASGRIGAARYRLFGPTILVALVERLCSLAEQKTLAQAARISSHLISEPFSQLETLGREYAEVCRKALQRAIASGEGIDSEISTPLQAIDSLDRCEDFESLSHEVQLEWVERVFDEKICPFIALDGGGVNIDRLEEDQLFIRYEGACTSCPASLGGTMNAIQSMLTQVFGPKLRVIPILGEMDASVG